MAVEQDLTGTLGANLWVIQRQVDGLTDEDSYLQPPFSGNCLNWVLGHIVVGRNRMLVLLEQEPLWGDAETALYQTGSEPIVVGGGALSLATLLETLERSQELIAVSLGQASEAQLAEIVPFRGRESSISDAIAGLAWHETYHTGQTELLRQLAGKNDKVI
ncbi:MAG: DinB family protein [Chloroflexota bacterium]|nr:DinB family protein [Chloroflexota bacterium]